MLATIYLMLFLLGLVAAIVLLFMVFDFIYSGLQELPSTAAMKFTHKFLYARFSVIVREERVNDEVKYKVYAKCWIFPAHYIHGGAYQKYDTAKTRANEIMCQERNKYDDRFMKKTKNLCTINSI